MAKIIYISSQRLPTEKAYGLQITKMCEAFADSGASVELLVPTRHNGDAKKIFEYYGARPNFKAITVWSPDFYWPGKLDRAAFLIKQWIAAFRLVRVAISRGADIIYSRDEFPIFLASFYSKHPKLVFEAHKFSSGKLIFYRRFKKINIKIIAISGGINDEFVKFGFKPTDVLVAHDGVDVDEFNIRENEEECRRKLGLPLDRRIVGYVGQLKTMGMEKGIEDLIGAIDILVTDYPELILVIVGGSMRDLDYYRSVASQRGLGEKVFFLGRKEHKDIPFYLRAFDVLAMPFPNMPHYALYMSPLKMFEYMASGKPIIATDLPAVREILNQNNALLIEPNNIEALVKAIGIVLTNHELGAILGRQAFIDAQNHSWDKRAQIIINILN